MRRRLLDQRWPWLLAAGVLVAVILSTFLEVRLPGDRDGRRLGSVEDIEALRFRDDVNVLFILVDTLRAERMSAYGYERETTPALTRFAAEGVRFGRQLAQSSWTKASMASLWTGLYPARTGITRYDDMLAGDAVTAAELMREAGFQTVGLYRNGWVAPTFGFDQGFDVYMRPTPRPPPPHIRRENPTLSDRGTDEGVIEAALEFIRVNGSERWFLYLHLMDLHEYIYDEESALFGAGYGDVYDNSIRWTDRTLEILFESLDAMGQLDDTLIVLASDHGEAFRERGIEGHARGVYRESTEVPFLISFPFRLEEGIVVETRTQNVDVWPTVLDLLGLSVPADVDGQSRVPEILASAAGQTVDAPEAVAISALDRTWGQSALDPQPTIAVVEDGYRYVRVEHPGEPREEHLFDGKSDPKEMQDRAGQDPDRVERLSAVADAYYEKQPAWGEAPTRELDELELNLLRALGYVIE